MSSEIRRFYDFGKFRLDPAEKILFCEDRPVPLRPKVFDMLQMFIENPGHLLQKEELIRAIWQDRFVEESNLTFNIKMLRRALQDDPRAPRFIETVPRRGYRFIAEVTEKSAPVHARENGHADVSVPMVEAKTASAAGVAEKWRGRPAHDDHAQDARATILARPARFYFAMGGLLVVLIAAAVILFRPVRLAASHSAAPILSAPFKSEKFATGGGGSTHAVITPDGEYVAYTSESQGKQSLWLRQLKSGENIQIVPPADTAYVGMTTSHDGKSIYFVRQTPTGSAMFRVGTFGGVPVKLVERLGGLISASPDDKLLSFVRCDYSDDDYCSLFVVNADGTNERKVLTRPRPIRIAANQFAPDGKSIAFAAGQSLGGGNDFRLLRLDLATGQEREISQTRFFNIKDLKWLPDASGLLLAVKESFEGRLRIWHVSTTSGEARPLTSDPTDYISLSLDRAADRMVATEVTNTFHLYVAAFDHLEHPNIVDSAINGFTFARDGKIVYAAMDGNIWSINSDGSERRQLTRDPANEIFPRVSPDGQYIFFTSNRTGANNIWRMNSDGSNQIQITKRECGYPKFVTADGRWLYFESSIRQTLWRVATDGTGEESQVFSEKVDEVTASPDRKLMAYFDGGNRLVVTSPDNQKIIKTFALPDNESEPGRTAWASDGMSLFYNTTKGDNQTLWQQLLDGSQPRRLADLGNEVLGELAVSPDGKSFAFIRGRWIHDAVLIEGLK